MKTKLLSVGVKRSSLLVGMVALLVVLAGCAPSVSPVPVVKAAAETAVPAAPPTAAPVVELTVASEGTTVKVATDEKFGSFLVDERGMALYLYTKDTENVSNCYDQCAVN